MNPKKSKSANLEDKRTIFLEIGMIIALALVLTAFNWKSYDRQNSWIQPGTLEDFTEELPPITLQKPPEPPPIEIVQAPLVLNIVDNDAQLDDDLFIDVDINPAEPVPVYEPVILLEEELPVSEVDIFKIVEDMPQFPGGLEALYKYLAENIKYPQMAKEAGISGKVYLTFVVERDGSITDVQVIRGIGGGCDEEALRVIEKMPSWTPGKQRNIPVRVQFVLDVKFTLQGF